MSRNPSLPYDPRTIAREVAGVFESVFPELVPGVVSHFNRRYAFKIEGCTPVEKDDLVDCNLQPAMLFELAIVLGEALLLGETPVNWEACLDKARSRQQRYFDAQEPKELKPADRKVALLVANNLYVMLTTISASQDSAVLAQPRIPGYRWIASGVGDFATNNSIIEVKCSGKRFSTADYRQIVIYWLLAYIKGLESDLTPWTTGILLNPRLCFAVRFDFGDLIQVIAARRSPVEIVESFGAIFDDSWTLQSADAS